MNLYHYTKIEMASEVFIHEAININNHDLKRTSTIYEGVKIQNSKEHNTKPINIVNKKRQLLFHSFDNRKRCEVNFP